jgi:NADH-quinone oxidoreductase subunit A
VLFHFATVLIFLVGAVAFVLAILIIGSFIRPKLPHDEKLSVYECGERPIGAAWFNFNPRFYIIALIFIVFEVEIALTFPVAVVYKDWLARHLGRVAFVELAVFLLILAVALVYVWRKGDLEWLKTLDHRPPLRGRKQGESSR